MSACPVFHWGSSLERPSRWASGTGDRRQSWGPRPLSFSTASGGPRRTRGAGPQPPPAPPAPRIPRPRPASRPRAAPAVPPSGVTGARAPAARTASAAELSAGRTDRERASGERSAQPRSPGAREPERAPPGEAAFPPARRPPPDGDAAPQPGADAREGPGAAAGGSSLQALAALEPRLALLLGARRLPGGLGEGPAPRQPPAASVPGGEPHLVLYLELAGAGGGSGSRGAGGACLLLSARPLAGG